MHIKNLNMVLLLDIYGCMLSDNRKNLMQLYYEEDLSLGEIASMQNITRQAVYDSIKKSTSLLEETEEKLQFAKKYSQIRENYEAIQNEVSALPDSCEKNNINNLVCNGMKML